VRTSDGNHRIFAGHNYGFSGKIEFYGAIWPGIAADFANEVFTGDSIKTNRAEKNYSHIRQ
jgi:hypothetical protein